MSKIIKKRLKEDIIEVLLASNDAPGALEIIERLKKHRVNKALKELEAEGVIERSTLYQGWRLKKEVSD
ncbi:MAG: hypothetical protein HWN68_19025 [Desulfobacterales bacterium]|nr:hypothetical protein [Desulfobacterales bacterium]